MSTINLFKRGKIDEKAAQKWVLTMQNTLGLQHWTISLELNNLWPAEISCDNPACIDIDRVHSDATIYIKPSEYSNDAELKTVILHELMHARLCTIPNKETEHSAMLIEQAVMGVSELFKQLYKKTNGNNRPKRRKNTQTEA